MRHLAPSLATSTNEGGAGGLEVTSCEAESRDLLSADGSAWGVWLWVIQIIAEQSETCGPSGRSCRAQVDQQIEPDPFTYLLCLPSIVAEGVFQGISSCNYGDQQVQKSTGWASRLNTEARYPCYCPEEGLL